MPIGAAQLQKIKSRESICFPGFILCFALYPAYMKNRKVIRMKQGMRMPTDQSM